MSSGLLLLAQCVNGSRGEFMRTTYLLLRAVFTAFLLEVQARSLESSWAKLLPTNDCTFHRLPSQLSKLCLLYHGGQRLGESWISQASPCSVTVWKEEPIHWWNSLERLMDPGLGPRQCPLAYYLFLQADIVSTSSLVLWSYCFVPSRESVFCLSSLLSDLLTQDAILPSWARCPPLIVSPEVSKLNQNYCVDFRHIFILGICFCPLTNHVLQPPDGTTYKAEGGSGRVGQGQAHICASS